MLKLVNYLIVYTDQLRFKKSYTIAQYTPPTRNASALAVWTIRS